MILILFLNIILKEYKKSFEMGPFNSKNKIENLLLDSQKKMTSDRIDSIVDEVVGVVEDEPEIVDIVENHEEQRVVEEECIEDHIEDHEECLEDRDYIDDDFINNVAANSGHHFGKKKLKKSNRRHKHHKKT